MAPGMSAPVVKYFKTHRISTLALASYLYQAAFKTLYLLLIDFDIVYHVSNTTRWWASNRLKKSNNKA
ncbi:hypothetical protein CAL7102_00111 [Dulcicalothrix desertica PCC 7102]|nr:hypothetical protein CAL7102_00111 [Dulcicalothrix desertica PCC 7102]